MCSSNRADQHAHFPGRAAASIRRALNYDLSRYTIPSDSLQTLQSRLQQDLFQLAAAGGSRTAAASASAAAAAAAAAATSVPNLLRQILRHLQMPLVRQSHNFGITVLVHLEAAWKER
jgi:hypothetical protein